MYNSHHQKESPMTKYIAVTETAKLIRAALKEAFPEVKFSIKSRKYSGGSSIDVRWQDGPSYDQVNSIAKTFEGGYFDGMTDYKGGHVHMMNGEEISFGGDFVFCQRDISEDKVAKAAAIFAKADRADWWKLASRFGIKDCFKIADYATDAQNMGRLFLQNLAVPAFDGRTSKLAESVTLHRSY